MCLRAIELRREGNDLALLYLGLWQVIGELGQSRLSWLEELNVGVEKVLCAHTHFCGNDYLLHMLPMGSISDGTRCTRSGEFFSDVYIRQER